MSRSGSWTFGAVFLVWLCWSPLLSGAQDDITHPFEVESLQDIKKSLIDVNKNLSNWNQGDPCAAKWNGVLCFNTTLDDGYLHVRELQLLNMNLSGTLSPSLGNFSHMQILDFMWNNISGSIPKEIGDIKSLELLLLNGNQLTGPLPQELGYLPNLDRIQIDQNHISGPLPTSFQYLNKTKHFHMNNNSISGQIPQELSRLPSLVHFLLDNNNLTGHIPPEFANLPNILIIQLDNNNFQGTTIPESFGNISTLLKLSLRNCSLQGPMPNFGGIPKLGFLDLSWNQLNGSIPPDKLAENITNIDLSNNDLSGTIPLNFSGLPHLQKLLLANNSLTGSVPSTIWQNRTDTELLILNFVNNKLTNVSGSTNLPQNVTLWLQGNPACSNSSLDQFCGTPNELVSDENATTTSNSCPVAGCPTPFEYSPTSPVPCYCAAPLLIDYRLKSPGFSNFLPYKVTFEQYLTSGLDLNFYQLDLEYFEWQEGPRLKMDLKFFPVYDPNNTAHVFNTSEVQRILDMFTGWHIDDSDIFGPYELLSITLLEPYKNVIVSSSGNSSLSKGAIAGIVLGIIAGAVTLSAIVSLLILRVRLRDQHAVSKRHPPSKASIKTEGVKDFTYAEMALATNNFDISTQVGQGGYGKVYKGILVDGTAVAIKRAQEGSLQGEKEFLTEIELLSRLHHRNLVSLVGYCDEEGEQMLVYEFMEKGTLRDHLSGTLSYFPSDVSLIIPGSFILAKMQSKTQLPTVFDDDESNSKFLYSCFIGTIMVDPLRVFAVKTKEPLSFSTRLKIALSSAKGILYLHTEADPPIFHRDIKASNILLDSNFNAKVADFGLSRLAPVPDIEGTTPAHVSTVVKGTPGYLDPEYFLTHKLTDKSDVYSLGVVFLELLTGMQPISHGKNIVREVNVAYQSGMIFSVIDERMGSYPSDCVEKFLSLALRCCADETDIRPSMVGVVRELENIQLMMPDSYSKIKDSMTSTSPEKAMSLPSSSSAGKNPYLSSDVSGSDLVSGVIPTITPR